MKIAELAQVGTSIWLDDISISLKEVTAQLEVEGVKKFAQSWDELHSNVASVMAQ